MKQRFLFAHRLRLTLELAQTGLSSLTIALTLFFFTASNAIAQNQNLNTTISIALDANNNPPTPITNFSGAGGSTHYLIPSGVDFIVTVGASVTGSVAAQNPVMSVQIPAGLEPRFISGSTTQIEPAGQGGTFNPTNRTITWNLPTISSAISRTFTVKFTGGTTCDGAAALFESQVTASNFAAATSDPDLMMHAKAKNNWTISKSSTLPVNPANNARYLTAAYGNTNATTTRVEYILATYAPIFDGGNYIITNYTLYDALPAGAVPISLDARRASSSSIGAWVNIPVANLSASNTVSVLIAPGTYPSNLDLSLELGGSFVQYRLTVDYPNGSFNTSTNNPLLNTASIINMQLPNNCGLDGGTGNPSTNSAVSNQTIIDLEQASHGGTFTKGVGQHAIPGCIGSYYVDFMNNGTEAIRAPINITDAMPADMSLVSIQGAWHGTMQSSSLPLNYGVILNNTGTYQAITDFSAMQPVTHLQYQLFNTNGGNSVVILPGGGFRLWLSVKLDANVPSQAIRNNCAALTYTHPLTNTATTMNSCVDMIAQSQSTGLYLYKVVCENDPNRIRSINEEVLYFMSVSNTGSTAIPAGKVINDLLPTGMTYVANSARMYRASSGNQNCAGLYANVPTTTNTWLSTLEPTISTINGRQNVSWTTSIAYPSACTSGFDETYLMFKAKINNGTLTISDNTFSIAHNNTTFTSNVARIYVAQRDSMVITKEVSKDNGANWSSNVSVNAGSTVKYRIKLQNLGNNPSANIRLYERLPQVGDTRLINCAARNSQFDILNPTNWQSVVQASGSTATTTLTPTIGSSTLTSCLGTGTCAMTSFASPTVSTDNLYRADFGTFSLQPGETITTTFDAVVPATVTGTKTAINSAAVCFGGNVLPPTESNEVSVSICNVSVAINGASQVCAGSTINLTAAGTPTGNYTYNWSTNTSETASLTVASAGIYTVTATSAAGCTGTASFAVSINNDCCTANFNAGADKVICTGSSTTLNSPPAAGNYFSYAWLPTTGLSAANIASPIASPAATTTYTVTASSYGNNLITNGDFSAGNTGFTSEYTAVLPAGRTYGTYAVLSTFWGTTWADHSPTTDNMFMSIDGSTVTTNDNIWVQNGIGVTPNTSYEFSFWATDSEVSAPVIQMIINGTVVSTANVTQVTVGTALPWRKYSATWNSGVSTTANLTLRNTNFAGSGNDFALDDITLARVCTYTDEVVVTVNPLPTITFTGNTKPCNGANTAITAVASGGTAPYTFTWNTGTTTNSATQNLGTGTFTVTVTDASGCMTTKSVSVVIGTTPTAVITVTGTTCPRTLTASGGGTYVWNTGATTATLSATTSGAYTVTVTNTAGCTATASVTVDCCNLQITELRSLIYVHAQAVTFPTPTVTGCTTGSTLTYLWEFGDGTTSTSASPTKTYTTVGVYNVCLTVTCTAPNGTFCRAKCCREINIGKNCPLLYPTFSHTVPAAGLAYTFTGTIQSTSVVPAPVSTYEIYNSANTLVATLTGTNATYTFPNNGEYTVCRNLAYTADATYGAACTAKNCRKITVMPTTGCNATAKFVATTYKANPLNVTFNASSYSTGATSYYWEYGTSPTGTFTQLGTAANAALGTPTFLFPTAGVYWVRLTINKGTPCETAIIARINLNAFTCTASSSTTPTGNRNANPDGSIEVGNSDINDGIGLYPNPTDSNVTITFGNDIKATTMIRVYDMKGQLVSSFRTQEGDNQTVIDLSNQAAGMYLFHIENESGELLVKKVMKQ